jgi:hypothetical protein
VLYDGLGVSSVTLPSRLSWCYVVFFSFEQYMCNPELDAYYLWYKQFMFLKIDS